MTIHHDNMGVYKYDVSLITPRNCKHFKLVGKGYVSGKIKECKFYISLVNNVNTTLSKCYYTGSWGHTHTGHGTQDGHYFNGY